MKTVKIDRPVNLNLLTEELFEAFPEWVYASPFDGSPTTDVMVTAEEIMLPDHVDEAAVRGVMAAHDEKSKSRNQRRAEEKARERADRAERIRKAKSVEELREVLLEILESE